MGLSQRRIAVHVLVLAASAPAAAQEDDLPPGPETIEAQGVAAPAAPAPAADDKPAAPRPRDQERRRREDAYRDEAIDAAFSCFEGQRSICDRFEGGRLGALYELLDACNEGDDEACRATSRADPDDLVEACTEGHQQRACKVLVDTDRHWVRGQGLRRAGYALWATSAGAAVAGALLLAYGTGGLTGERPELGWFWDIYGVVALFYSGASLVIATILWPIGYLKAQQIVDLAKKGPGAPAPPAGARLPVPRLDFALGWSFAF